MPLEEHEQSRAHITIMVVESVYHVLVDTYGRDRDAAQKLAADLLRFLGQGRFAFIRTEPEASTYTDFETDKTTHRGYVRFAFKDEPGEWQYRAKDEPISISLGFKP